MAITKFKISRLPLVGSLKISGGNVPLNQEYHISQQNAMTFEVFDRGVPYDTFGFRLGNDYGDWSPEYNCTINALVNSSTPLINSVNLSVATAAQTDITADIVWNDSTDRFTIVSIVGNGYLLINGSIAVVGQVYYVSDITTIIFVSISNIDAQNDQTTIVLTPANSNETGPAANIVLTTSSNLRGIINPNPDEADEYVFGTLIIKTYNPLIQGEINGIATVNGNLTGLTWEGIISGTSMVTGTLTTV